MKRITKDIILFFLAGCILGWLWGVASTLNKVAELGIKVLELNMSKADIIYAITRLN